MSTGHAPAIYPWALRRTAGDHRAAAALCDDIAAWVVAQGEDDLWAQLRTRFRTQRALARALGSHESAVSLWFSARSIPERWWQPIIEAAGRLDPPLAVTRADLVSAHRRHGFGGAS